MQHRYKSWIALQAAQNFDVAFTVLPIKISTFSDTFLRYGCRILPLCSVLVLQIESAVSSAELPRTREFCMSWSKSSEGSQIYLRDWSIWHTRRGCKRWMAQREPEKRRLRGNLIHVYKFLTGECGACNEEGARLFSAALAERTWANRRKLTQGKKKHF